MVLGSSVQKTSRFMSARLAGPSGNTSSTRRVAPLSALQRTLKAPSSNSPMKARPNPRKSAARKANFCRKSSSCPIEPSSEETSSSWCSSWVCARELLYSSAFAIATEPNPATAEITDFSSVLNAPSWRGYTRMAPSVWDVRKGAAISIPVGTRLPSACVAESIGTATGSPAPTARDARSAANCNPLRSCLARADAAS